MKTNLLFTLVLAMVSFGFVSGSETRDRLKNTLSAANEEIISSQDLAETAIDDRDRWRSEAKKLTAADHPAGYVFDKQKNTWVRPPCPPHHDGVAWVWWNEGKWAPAPDSDPKKYLGGSQHGGHANGTGQHNGRALPPGARKGYILDEHNWVWVRPVRTNPSHEWCDERGSWCDCKRQRPVVYVQHSVSREYCHPECRDWEYDRERRHYSAPRGRQCSRGNGWNPIQGFFVIGAALIGNRR